jgi:hypothetical protein
LITVSWFYYPWLLKNSLCKNPQKIDHVRMPYKRFVGVAWTFSIPQFVLVFSDFEFFNSHTRYQPATIANALSDNGLRVTWPKIRLCGTDCEPSRERTGWDGPARITKTTGASII